MTKLKAPKSRDPASHLKAQGGLRTRVVADKRRKQGRKAKHKNLSV